MSSTRPDVEAESSTSINSFLCLPHFSMFGQSRHEEETPLLSSTDSPDETPMLPSTDSSEDTQFYSMTKHDCKNIVIYLGCTLCLVGASYLFAIEGVSLGTALYNTILNINPPLTPCLDMLNPATFNGTIGWTWLGISMVCEGCLLYGSSCMTVDCTPDDETETCFFNPNRRG